MSFLYDSVYWWDNLCFQSCKKQTQMTCKALRPLVVVMKWIRVHVCSFEKGTCVWLCCRDLIIITKSLLHIIQFLQSNLWAEYEAFKKVYLLAHLSESLRWPIAIGLCPQLSVVCNPCDFLQNLVYSIPEERNYKL